MCSFFMPFPEILFAVFYIASGYGFVEYANSYQFLKLISENFSGSDQSFPPSFRMHRNYSFPVHRGSHNGHRKDRKRTRLLNQLKKGAGVIKSSLPKIKDVNVIDKYSRVVFPVSFILFNVAYWCFYVIDDPESNS